MPEMTLGPKETSTLVISIPDSGRGTPAVGTTAQLSTCNARDDRLSFRNLYGPACFVSNPRLEPRDVATRTIRRKPFDVSGGWRRA